MSENLRKDASDIFLRAVSAVDPATCIHRSVKKENNHFTIGNNVYDLDSYDNIYLISVGKAAVSQAKAIEDIAGNQITDGIVLTKYGYATSGLVHSPVFEAGHPIPDNNGMQVTRKIKRIVEKAEKSDLIFFLISGGGSALLTLPREGIGLHDVISVTDQLLKAGATIAEMNTVRKHLSEVKGGRLARLAYPAESISLILSDVVGDPLDVIASGPTFPDYSTFSECEEIVQKYGLVLPQPVIDLFEKGLRGVIEETPKQDDPVFTRCHHYLVGNNSMAINAAEEKAGELGYNALVLTSFLTGEARQIAKVFAAISKEEKKQKKPVKLPACIIAGGETTVSVTGGGRGGRCQELALSFALQVNGLSNLLLLAAGTDGTDGPTDAAGAFADGHTVIRSKRAEIDALNMLLENDSYSFFKEIDDLFITGPTGTNVMDIYLLLISD